MIEMELLLALTETWDEQIQENVVDICQSQYLFKVDDPFTWYDESTMAFQASMLDIYFVPTGLWICYISYTLILGMHYF